MPPLSYREGPPSATQFGNAPLYNSEFRTGKFLPLVFGTEHIASMPTVFVGNTYYDVSKPDGLEALVRLMTDQPAHVPAPLGKVPHLPPKNE
jgi:hypothetical protein